MLDKYKKNISTEYYYINNYINLYALLYSLKYLCTYFPCRPPRKDRRVHQADNAHNWWRVGLLKNKR